ncbi:hypothetical protein C8J57DRAFT_1528915 [Mycena rebaudengoi]|nr:hypothetical protein C8J57DRAFT_1528915 [Mycena rebaudengoi]
MTPPDILRSRLREPDDAVSTHTDGQTRVAASTQDGVLRGMETTSTDTRVGLDGESREGHWTWTLLTAAVAGALRDALKRSIRSAPRKQRQNRAAGHVSPKASVVRYISHLRD